jgi:hypothetical protein
MHKVSQVGAEQAHIELQVVNLEKLGTADKLAVHLAQVSQVDQVPQVRVLDWSQAVRWPSGLAGRLSNLVRIANPRVPSRVPRVPSACGWHSWKLASHF